MKTEQTSKKVAAKAGAALRGPNKDAAEAAFERYQDRNAQVRGDAASFLAGARWWHRQVKSAVASALTQAKDKKR